MTGQLLLKDALHTPQLNKDNVDIWCISLKMDESSLGIFYEYLSKDESQRAERMRFSKIKRRYVASRGLLRWIVGAYLDVKPASLEFLYGPHGKPELSGQFSSSRINFNMSHSHDLALYGVCLDRALGVDIEKIRENMSFLKIAKRFFSDLEYETMADLPRAQLKHGFYNCWTRKEAYIKAKGESISSAISRFSVSLIPGEPAEMLDHHQDPSEISRWSFMDLDVPSDFKAAVVTERSGISVTRVGNEIITLDDFMTC